MTLRLQPTSAAGASPPAVLVDRRRSEPPSQEPGPHATGWPQINWQLGAGSQVRHVRPGRPPPPSAHGRQKQDGGSGLPHRRRRPPQERSSQGTGGLPPSRRPARTRPVPTAVRSGLPRRECRHTARASRTSRREAASARSSRTRSSARSSRVSMPTSPPPTTGLKQIGMAYLHANTAKLGNSISICAMSTTLL